MCRPRAAHTPAPDLPMLYHTYSPKFEPEWFLRTWIRTNIPAWRDEMGPTRLSPPRGTESVCSPVTASYPEIAKVSELPKSSGIVCSAYNKSCLANARPQGHVCKDFAAAATIVTGGRVATKRHTRITSTRQARTKTTVSLRSLQRAPQGSACAGERLPATRPTLAPDNRRQSDPDPGRQPRRGEAHSPNIRLHLRGSPPNGLARVTLQHDRRLGATATPSAESAARPVTPEHVVLAPDKRTRKTQIYKLLGGHSPQSRGAPSDARKLATPVVWNTTR